MPASTTVVMAVKMTATIASEWLRIRKNQPIAVRP